MADSGKMKKDENGLFWRRFFRYFSYYLNMLHSYHTDRAGTRECGVMRLHGKQLPDAKTARPHPTLPRLRGGVGGGGAVSVGGQAANARGDSCGPIVDPL